MINDEQQLCLLDLSMGIDFNRKFLFRKRKFGEEDVNLVKKLKYVKDINLVKKLKFEDDVKLIKILKIVEGINLFKNLKSSDDEIVKDYYSDFKSKDIYVLRFSVSLFLNKVVENYVVDIQVD